MNSSSKPEKDGREKKPDMVVRPRREDAYVTPVTTCFLRSGYLAPAFSVTTSMSTDSMRKLPPPKPDLSFARPPKSPVALYFWRWRMWFESTFVLSMLEPWEKIMLLTILFILITLFMTGVFNFMPQHLERMHQRAVYYLWGQEGDKTSLWQWVNSRSAQVLGRREL